jgi:hypothetical protein
MDNLHILVQNHQLIWIYSFFFYVFLIIRQIIGPVPDITNGISLWYIFYQGLVFGHALGLGLGPSGEEDKNQMTTILGMYQCFDSLVSVSLALRIHGHGLFGNGVWSGALSLTFTIL